MLRLRTAFETVIAMHAHEEQAVKCVTVSDLELSGVKDSKLLTKDFAFHADFFAYKRNPVCVTVR